MAGNAAQESVEIDVKDLPFEFMLNALRLNQGFPVNLFQERTGLVINFIEKNCYLPRKKDFCNAIIKRLYPHQWVSCF